MKVDELRKQLARLNLDTTGKKPKIYSRLKEALLKRTNSNEGDDNEIQDDVDYEEKDESEEGKIFWPCCQ